MLTIPQAARALERASDLDGLERLARLIGFAGASAPLDGEPAATLGLARDAVARVVAGTGTRRALLLASASDRPLRDLVSRAAARIASAAPHARWLVLAAARDEVIVAASDAARPGGRVAALAARRTRIVDSDAETIRALVAADGTDDVLAHTRCLELLGRDGLSRRFYRALERVVHALADDAAASLPRAIESERVDLALLQVSRLLFLSFLEAKGWLDADPAFLAHRFDGCMRAGGGFHRRVLLPLFFGTLNTPLSRRAPTARALGRIPFLNGGLFARTPLETRHRALRLSDESLGRCFSELLGRYRFTVREESLRWSEAAVDPEMLGRAFESLMASRLRRESGAFFTPHALVERITALALRDALGGAASDSHVGALLGGEPPDDPEARAALARRLRSLRIIDPACGSGAFLVHALERIAASLATLGDARPIDAIRREVLASSIFGVDVSPTAVWLCELRLWLSTVIESDTRDPLAVPPLPNLDHHVRVGDALAGGAFDATTNGLRGARALERLRGRYVRAVGRRKATLARALDAEERAQAIASIERELARADDARRDALSAARGRDLFGARLGTDAAGRAALRELGERVRALRARRRSLAHGGALPFAFATHFADVGARGGFDVVLGNPPWVRLHRIAPAARVALRHAFRVFREAAWRDGASDARVARGFASQVDLAALFVERGLSLLRDGGALALLVPAKLWRSLAGGGVRRMLLDEHQLIEVDDLSGGPSTFDAAVYPSIVLARSRRAPREQPRPRPTATVRAATSLDAPHWCLPAEHLALDASPGAPWLLAPPDVRRAFERMRDAGMRLGATSLAPVMLGVKCGVNDAFAVSLLDARGAHALVRGRSPDRDTHAPRDRDGLVERALLRPLARGEDVRAWRLDSRDAHLLWTMDERGAPLSKLPDGAARWLAPWRRRLAERADAARASRWWTLHRTAGAACDSPRVVWPDVARAPRATVLATGDPTVPLNSCYVARCPSLDDALALAAILNSPLASAWLRLVAEPARGGYVRLMAWCTSMLPLPLDWPAAVRMLAPAGRAALAGSAPPPDELLRLTLRAYALRRASVAALLAWDGA